MPLFSKVYVAHGSFIVTLPSSDRVFLVYTVRTRDDGTTNTRLFGWAKNNSGAPQTFALSFGASTLGESMNDPSLLPSGLVQQSAHRDGFSLYPLSKLNRSYDMNEMLPWRNTKWRQHCVDDEGSVSVRRVIKEAMHRWDMLNGERTPSFDEVSAECQDEPSLTTRRSCEGFLYLAVIVSLIPDPTMQSYFKRRWLELETNFFLEAGNIDPLGLYVCMKSRKDPNVLERIVTRGIPFTDLLPLVRRREVVIKGGQVVSYCEGSPVFDTSSDSRAVYLLEHFDFWYTFVKSLYSDSLVRFMDGLDGFSQSRDFKFLSTYIDSIAKTVFGERAVKLSLQRSSDVLYHLPRGTPPIDDWLSSPGTIYDQGLMPLCMTRFHEKMSRGHWLKHSDGVFVYIFYLSHFFDHETLVEWFHHMPMDKHQAKRRCSSKQDVELRVKVDSVKPDDDRHRKFSCRETIRKNFCPFGRCGDPNSGAMRSCLRSMGCDRSVGDIEDIADPACMSVIAIKSRLGQ